MQLSPANLAVVSAVAGSRKAEGSSGAIAIVAESDAEREVGAYFASRIAGRRPCRLFDDVAEARAWLDGTGIEGQGV